jgi:dipeptidyl-peptidase-4
MRNEESDKLEIPMHAILRCLLPLACCLLPCFAAADELVDAQFLRDYTITRGFMLGRPTSAKPTPDGSAVLFLRSPPRSPVMHLFEFDVATKQTRELLTPAQLLKGAEENLSPEEKARRERQRITARGFTSYQMSEEGDKLLIPFSGKIYIYYRKDGKSVELPTGKGVLIDPKFAPDGKSVAYVLDHDVYVMDLETKKERRLTTGGTEDVSHGLAEFVAQEEMDRSSGFWWSPDSKYIAYEEADARDVEIWHIGNPLKPGEDPVPQRYPRPGKSNVKVRLGVVKVDGGETVWLKWDHDKFPYLTVVRWDKNSPLTLLVEDRKQNDISMRIADLSKGETEEIYGESGGDYWMNIDPQMPRWLEDGVSFLVRSEGLATLDLVQSPKVGGKTLLRPLTFGAFTYSGFVSVDEKTRAVYCLGEKNPTERHLWRINLDGKSQEYEQLTTGPGIHGAVFSKNHSIYVVRTTEPMAMPRTVVYKVNGTRIAELPSEAVEPPFTPATEILQVRDEDGPYCRITRPRKFDKAKRYPVLVDVYGGPGHQQVMAAMGTALLPQWLADQGFIVVAIDGRGTPARGRDWEQAIRGNFGKVPLDDQIAGLKALGAKFPEMDLDRVGITGWSFGGYLSALAVLKRGDVFKAAVAGAPVTDWEMYDTHYTERYLGLPDENKEGYKDSSLLTYVDKLERPLMLIHGTTDDNVYFAHTMKLADALFKAGKEFELLPLNGFTHMVPDPKVRERLEERIVRFFHKHLGEPK